MTDDAEDTIGFELVMPFVCCASQGGPYDDEAFVAGYELGMLSARLEAQPPFLRLPLRTASMRQVDLIAMRHGYSLASHVCPMPEWTECSFIKVAP